jgi:hypothetical protein
VTPQQRRRRRIERFNGKVLRPLFQRALNNYLATAGEGSLDPDALADYDEMGQLFHAIAAIEQKILVLDDE